MDAALSCNIYLYSGTLECDHPDNLTILLIGPLFDRPVWDFFVQIDLPPGTTCIQATLTKWPPYQSHQFCPSQKRSNYQGSTVNVYSSLLCRNMHNLFDMAEIYLFNAYLKLMSCLSVGMAGLAGADFRRTKTLLEVELKSMGLRICTASSVPCNPSLIWDLICIWWCVFPATVPEEERFTWNSLLRCVKWLYKYAQHI